MFVISCDLQSVKFGRGKRERRGRDLEWEGGGTPILYLSLLDDVI